MIQSCYTILDILQRNSALRTNPSANLFVSDGSASSGSMSFGWVLSTHNGEILIRCSGPAPGKESSFRSEGYGMLSVVRFLFHLFEYCQQTHPGPFRFITDNQGLLTRVQSALQYDDPYPNSTLEPEWDVVNEIVSTLQGLPIELIRP